MAEHDILPDNSIKARIREQNERPVLEREHAKPVAKRLDIPAKETTAQRLKKLFFSEDIDNVGEYLVKELIIPGAKDLFMDFMSAVLWGNRSGYSGRNSSKKFGIGRNEQINYNRLSSVGQVRNRNDSRVRDDRGSIQREFNLDNILLRTKAEADETLRQMEDYIYSYGQVSVGYLYELLNEPTSQWTVEMYGWTDLSDARITRVQNGYLLTLPRPVRFEK